MEHFLIKFLTISCDSRPFGPGGGAQILFTTKLFGELKPKTKFQNPRQIFYILEYFHNITIPPAMKTLPGLDVVRTMGIDQKTTDQIED
jgi:hypothetical protein